MDKVKDGIFGVIVGDALGLPFQFKERGSFHATDMVGRGTFNLPAGSWSDDSSLTIATLVSLTNKKTVDPDDIMHNFSRWYTMGEFTPYGLPYDIGGGTSRSIENYLAGFDVAHCGLRGYNENGNGSLMRILPLALFDASDDEVAAVSALTHAHAMSVEACQIYVAIAKRIISGETPEKAVKNTMSENPYFGYSRFMHLADVEELEEDDVESSGFVFHTITAALWCLLTTGSYSECVLKAVNLGLDTDTTAAVAGGLAGLYYGIGGDYGIPTEWIDTLARKKWLDGLCEKFSKALKM